MPMPPIPDDASEASGLWTGSVLLAGFVAGVALQLQQRALDPPAVYALLLAVSGAVWGALGLWGRSARPARWWRRARQAMVLAGALAAGFGFAGLRAVAVAGQALDPSLEGVDLSVVGTVAAMPQRIEPGVRFRLDVESATRDGVPVALPPRLLLGWYGGPTVAADGATLELLRQPADLRAGERWRMTVRLKAPHGSLNPHGPDPGSARLVLVSK